MNDPREVAERDQLLAAVRELTALLATHYRGLREEGLTVEEAIALTIARQRDLMFGYQEDGEV